MRPLVIVLSLAAFGCPDPSGGAKSSPGPSAGSSGTPAATPASDPLEGSLFSKDELFALYRAKMAPETDPAAIALLKKHRLIDDEGKPVKARRDAFQRSLQTYAERDKDGWSEFIEGLAQR